MDDLEGIIRTLLRGFDECMEAEGVTEQARHRVINRVVYGHPESPDQLVGQENFSSILPPLQFFNPHTVTYISPLHTTTRGPWSGQRS